MNPLNIVLSLAPSIITMLKFKGIDVDIEFVKALEIIPNFIEEKQEEYQKNYPDLDINLMVSFHEKEVYLMPVGIEVLDQKTVITKQFDAINVSKFLSGIKVTELLNVLKKNPNMPIMEAVEKSRV